MSNGGRNVRPGSGATAVAGDTSHTDAARAVVGAAGEVGAGEVNPDTTDWKAKYEALKSEGDNRAAAEKKRRLNVKRLGVALVTPLDPDDNGQQRTNAIRNAVVALISDLLPGDDE